MSANDELAAMVAARQNAPADVGAITSPDQTQPFLLMRLDERWCAIRAESVREVVSMDSVNRVPAQPEHVLGVMLVHGRLVPVVDICKLPGSAFRLESSGRRLVVINSDNLDLGVVADDAKGVIYLPAATKAPSSSVPAFVIGEAQWDDKLVCLFEESRLIKAALGAELT